MPAAPQIKLRLESAKEHSLQEWYEQRPYYIGIFGVHIAMLEKAVQHEHLSNFEGYKQRRLFTLLT